MLREALRPPLRPQRREVVRAIRSNFRVDPAAVSVSSECQLKVSLITLVVQARHFQFPLVRNAALADQLSVCRDSFVLCLI